MFMDERNRNRVGSRMLRASLTSLGLSIPFTTAFAGGPSPVVFRAEASNIVGVGLVEITFEAGIWDAESSSFTYIQAEPLEIISETTGDALASLDNCYLFFRTGAVNEIQLNFSVRGLVDQTIFVAESPVLQYLSVPAAEARGRAVASFSVSDQDGNGAYLIGIGEGAGPGAYTARVNATSESAGTPYSNLVNFVFAGPGGSAVVTQNDPPSGYRPIGTVTRSSMVHFSFQTTIDDAITATTRFNVLGRSELCPGDVDADGDVDVQDFSNFLASFGASTGDVNYTPDVDLLSDGLIDINDLGQMLSQFGTQCP